jgi:hypothetical protein
LSCFYGVRPTSALISYGITVISTALPFAVLRRPSSVHDLSHTPSIFSVVLYISYASWLPEQLVVHFESLPDISAAHAGPAGLPVLFLTLAPAGWAARDFLFVSSTGYAINDTQSASVSREGEYLIATIYRRTWGKLSTKSRVLISRSIILAAGILLNTIVQVAGTIRDVSIVGAATWGSVWAVSALVTGASFGWIEAVDGV